MNKVDVLFRIDEYKHEDGDHIVGVGGRRRRLELFPRHRPLTGGVDVRPLVVGPSCGDVRHALDVHHPLCYGHDHIISRGENYRSTLYTWISVRVKQRV